MIQFLLYQALGSAPHHTCIINHLGISLEVINVEIGYQT